MLISTISMFKDVPLVYPVQVEIYVLIKKVLTFQSSGDRSSPLEKGMFHQTPVHVSK